MSKLKKYFKNVAIETSKLSTCRSVQVGAILVKDKRIISIGYNGVSSGSKHCNEIFNKDFNRMEHHVWSLYNELHAEQNLISFCAKNGIETNDTILYVTTSPCIHCAKLIVASGIKEVFYVSKYDKECGIDFLSKNKVRVKQLDEVQRQTTMEEFENERKI